tara:strand:+ start:207 stop:905 length:699 start_codon:yes stop_codon:yes gene_type:complete
MQFSYMLAGVLNIFLVVAGYLDSAPYVIVLLLISLLSTFTFFFSHKTYESVFERSRNSQAILSRMSSAERYPRRTHMKNVDFGPMPPQQWVVRVWDPHPFFREIFLFFSPLQVGIVLVLLLLHPSQYQSTFWRMITLFVPSFACCLFTNSFVRLMERGTQDRTLLTLLAMDEQASYYNKYVCQLRRHALSQTDESNVYEKHEWLRPSREGEGNSGSHVTVSEKNPFQKKRRS